jgi:outer membrane receptor protein involved in Fe transport
VIFDNNFDEDNLSGRVTLAFRPTDTTNLWASFGKGYISRSGSQAHA